MADQPSRRNFLKSASLGVAVAGVASAAPIVLSESARASTIPLSDGPAHEGAVTAYVRDHRTGEIAVMSGEHEVVIQDRKLAGHLARLAARASRS